MDAIREDLLDQHWVKASKHYLGGGVEKRQPSLIPAKDVHKNLIKKGEHLQAAMLEKVVVGAAFHDGRNGYELICHTCGGRATASHTYWTCPHLRHHEHPEVKDTNGL